MRSETCEFAGGHTARAHNLQRAGQHKRECRKEAAERHLAQRRYDA